MARKSNKGLTEEDLRLWEAVKKTAQPLAQPSIPETSSIALRQRVEKPAKRVDLTRLSGERPPPSERSVFLLQDDPQDRLRSAPLNMDKKLNRKMNSGKLKPDARIDLHGMTLAQAHPTLRNFIHASAAAGRRLVLVITGKGKDRDDGDPIPTRVGVLRHQVPQWLQQSDMARYVLQISPASRNYGGSGAYFVYLRRNR